jgi:hypothetical protein
MARAVDSGRSPGLQFGSTVGRGRRPLRARPEPASPRRPATPHARAGRQETFPACRGGPSGFPPNRLSTTCGSLGPARKPKRSTWLPRRRRKSVAGPNWDWTCASGRLRSPARRVAVASPRCCDAGVQRLGDPAVAPPVASLRHVRFQENAGSHQQMLRALALADQRLEPSPFLLAQPDHVLLDGNLFAGRESSPSLNRAAQVQTTPSKAMT